MSDELPFGFASLSDAVQRSRVESHWLAVKDGDDTPVAFVAPSALGSFRGESVTFADVLSRKDINAVTVRNLDLPDVFRQRVQRLEHKFKVNVVILVEPDPLIGWPTGTCEDCYAKPCIC